MVTVAGSGMGAIAVIVNNILADASAEAFEREELSADATENTVPNRSMMLSNAGSSMVKTDTLSRASDLAQPVKATEAQLTRACSIIRPPLSILRMLLSPLPNASAFLSLVALAASFIVYCIKMLSKPGWSTRNLMCHVTIP